MPFPSYLWPLFQSESWCSSFHMKIGFHLHVNENLFSYERMSTKTRFEKEAKGNSEMVYCDILIINFELGMSFLSSRASLVKF